MQELVICRGLPASGKSTWALSVVEKDPSYVRVNRDEIRAMVHNDKWDHKREKVTVAMRDAMIVAALKMGKSVISDDTNLSPLVVSELMALAVNAPVEVRFQDFLNVTPQECIKRDLKRTRSVGADVIWKMYRQFLKPAPVEKDEALPKAILVDMDGTLAVIGDRSPYEDQHAERDLRHDPVADMVEGYLKFNSDVRFIVMSGRDEGRSREATTEWLAKNIDVQPHALFMRAAGDTRHDNIVKRELFDAHIRGQYDVQFVVDDRDQVVQMWRDELGLPTFQVNWGAF